MTPVVVSSMLPTTCLNACLRSAGLSFAAHSRTCACTSSSRSRATKIMAETRSAPSSMVTCGSCSRAGDVLVVGVRVLAVDGEDGDAEVLDQAGGHVVLGAERVGGDQHEVGAAGLEGAGEVGGLGGDVQAGRHAQAVERLFLGEALADAGQHRHVAVGPEDALLAAGGELGVFDVVAGERSGRHAGNLK